MIEGLTCDVVLGVPWLKLHNPQIDWRAGTLELLDASGCSHMCQDIGLAPSTDAPKVEMCGLKAVLKASRQRLTQGCWFGLFRCTDAGLFTASREE